MFWCIPQFLTSHNDPQVNTKYRLATTVRSMASTFIHVCSTCILIDILSFYKKRPLSSSLLCLFSAKIYLQKFATKQHYGVMPALHHHRSSLHQNFWHNSFSRNGREDQTANFHPGNQRFIPRAACTATKGPTMPTHGSPALGSRGKPLEPVLLPSVAPHYNLCTYTEMLSPVYFVRALEACQTYSEPIQFTILAKEEESSKKQNLKKKKKTNAKAAFCRVSSEEGLEEHQSLQTKAELQEEQAGCAGLCHAASPQVTPQGAALP